MTDGTWEREVQISRPEPGDLNLNLRPARLEDLEAVVAVMNAVDVATLGEPDTSEEDISTGWRETGFDLGADAFVAELDGRVVGYAEIYERDSDTFDTDVYANPLEDDALTQPLLDAVLERAAVRAGPGATLATWLPAADPRIRIFGARGFAPVRRFVRMRHDYDVGVEPFEAPSGITLRQFDRERDARAVHAVLVDAFAHHARPLTSSFERFTEQHLDHPDFDPRFWVVAEEGDDVVGAITAFNHTDIGFIRHVGVVAQGRGRGVGSALVLTAVRALANAGQLMVDLGVDLDDDVGAARLYEKLGFRVVQQLELVERRL